MNKPMEDFVTRGGLGELMAAATEALDELHTVAGVDASHWWRTTTRLGAAIKAAEKARELELNTAHPCAGCDVTDRAAQKRCISDPCPAKLRLDAEDGIATVACPGCGTSYRFGRANPARVECGECKTRFACMAELLLAHRRERGLD